MQDELRGNRQRPEESWAFTGAKDADVIGKVDDLDHLMGDLGFQQHREEGSAPSFHRGNGPGAPTGVVPRPFLDRMAAELGGPLGQKSSAIVTDRVAALGEYMETFPMARIWELTQLVSQEIVEREPRVRFLRRMSQEIRALPSH